MPRYLIPTLDLFSPKVCRLLARKCRGQTAMSFDDISLVSGLSRSTVIRISRKTTWRWMRADTIQRFSLACGVNLMANPRKHIKFIRSGMRGILKNSNPTQRKMLQRVITELSNADVKLAASDV